MQKCFIFKIHFVKLSSDGYRNGVLWQEQIAIYISFTIVNIC